MGKSCVRFRSADDLALDVPGDPPGLPVKTFVARYEERIGDRAKTAKGKPTGETTTRPAKARPAKTPRATTAKTTTVKRATTATAKTETKRSTTGRSTAAAKKKTVTAKAATKSK